MDMLWSVVEPVEPIFSEERKLSWSAARDRSAAVIGDLAAMNAAERLEDAFGNYRVPPLTWSERIDELTADIGSEWSNQDDWEDDAVALVRMAAMIADSRGHDGELWENYAPSLLRSLVFFDKEEETFARIRAELYRMANEADAVEAAMVKENGNL